MHRFSNVPENSVLTEGDKNLHRFDELQKKLLTAQIAFNGNLRNNLNVSTIKADPILIAEEIAEFTKQISGQYNTGQYYSSQFKNFIKNSPKFSTLARITGDYAEGIYIVTNHTITKDLATVGINQNFVKTQTEPPNFNNMSPEEVEKYTHRALTKSQIPDNTLVLFHNSFWEEVKQNQDVSPQLLESLIKEFEQQQIPDAKLLEAQQESIKEKVNNLTMPQAPEPIFFMEDFFSQKNSRYPLDISHPSKGYESDECSSGACSTGAQKPSGCNSGGCSGGTCPSKKRRP